MASPLPTHGQGPIQGDTQASAGGFHSSPSLADQGTKFSKTCIMKAAQFGPWSDLPTELLGLVLKRLDSLADRVRLRAVCQPWRSNSMLQNLPLPFPWLTLTDGTFLGIPGSEVHRMPLPDGARWHGSIDNRLFLMSCDGACSLLNPFSKSTLELPNLASVWQREIDNHAEYTDDAVSYKLLAPSPLESSPKSLAAALIIGNCYSVDLCVVQPPATTYSFRGIRTALGEPPTLVDLAFLDGRLYVVSGFFKLFVVDFGENLGTYPKMKCVIDSGGDCGTPQYLSKKVLYGLSQYLVECGGRLLMVQRFTHSQGFRNSHTVGFNVLEADLCTNPGQWRTVSDLGGHALFLGKQSSKSLPAGECSGSQEDCIYFICDYPCPESSAEPLRDAGIYNVRSGMIMPLHSRNPAVPQRQAGQWGLTWFFPSEAI
ncbi:uncharacterized protein LOC125523019 isoform X1 [Triticum urartu]|uniref:DUF295 domain-containing protein n=1 Tax=Triticum urartu TaxID=4572 RepID=A0A8R7R0F5_TRIUA|nr:uncharacterized protein LOC125523019 isoform X1 [Triticum urartu]